MANYGIKISKTGTDIASAGDDDLILTSKYNIPKVSASGASTVVVSSGSGTRTIAHGLGTTPIAIVYMEDVVNNNKRWFLNAREPIAFPFYFYVDGTNLVVTTGGTGPSDGTYNFYYYVFIDSL